MKEFTRNEIAMFKKVAGLVYPYDKKIQKCKEKILALQAEINTYQSVIDGFEGLVVEKTGYHVLDLFYLKETVTNRLDAKGNQVVDKSWQPKYETILPIEEAPVKEILDEAPTEDVLDEDQNLNVENFTETSENENITF